MRNKVKLFIFIVTFLISVFLSQLFDYYLVEPKDAENWWVFIITSPMIIVTFIFGILLTDIKQLFSYAFFAGLVLLICFLTQVYYEPSENIEEWLEISKGWVYALQYFAKAFAIMGLTSGVFLGMGMLSNYLIKVLFFPTLLCDSEKE